MEKGVKCPECGSSYVIYSKKRQVYVCEDCEHDFEIEDESGTEERWDVFISYAREDDEPFVEKLYEDLKKQGLRVWWDREAMESRGRTFLQEIRDAIASVDRVILVIGPKALESEYVRVEWDFALEVCRAVVPVLRMGDYPDVPEGLQLNHCPDFRTGREYKEALDELLRIMSEPVSPLGELNGVNALPAHFLQREDEIERLKDTVLPDTLKPVVITSAKQTTALKGMGGIGKSVLAAAFARSCDGRKVFGDGIFWIGLGENADLVGQMRRVGKGLGDEDPQHYVDEVTSKDSLSKLLANSTCLLVLDDVWKVKDAEAFVNALGPRCRALITTRDAEIAEGLGAQVHSLDVLSDEQALTLLARWAKQDEKTMPPEAREIINECGNLPLALAMVGAMIQDGSDMWEYVLHMFHTADIEEIERTFPNYAYPNLMLAIKVSVDSLKPEIQERYLDLAVFPKDTLIPEAALRVFWEPLGLDKYGIRRITRRLVNRSLAYQDHVGFISLHDLQVDYVRKQTDDPAALHNCLLDAYEAKCSDGWHTGSDDGYFFQYLPYHLAEAGRLEELEKLLMDFRWMEAKLKATDANALIGDYDLVTDGDLNLVQEAIRLSAHVIGIDKAQLAGQLTGRLLGFDSEKIGNMLERIKVEVAPPCLLPNTHNLRAPGGSLLRTLQGHTAHVWSVAVTPDSRHAISGSYDNTLRVWDLRAWKEVKVLKNHNESAFSVTVTPDNRYVISGSSDTTLKVWDMETWEEVKTLKGHTGYVYAVTVTPDGRYAISGSGYPDNTLKVWDLKTYEEVKTLVGHTNWVNSVTVTPDGHYVISGSDDRTLKVWDLKTWEEVKTLEGHTGHVNSVTVTPDGRYIISGSGDHTGDYTLKVWDLETWEEVKTLKGHTSIVKEIAVTCDSHYAISGAYDNTLKVWDLRTWEEVKTLEGHASIVLSVSTIPNSHMVISGSNDHTLKLWDLDIIEKERPEEHASNIRSMAVTLDSYYAISGSGHPDCELKVWDMKTWKKVKTLKGHTSEIGTIIVTPDNRYTISGSGDTLKIWDMETWEEVRTLERHTYWVDAIAVTPNKRHAISGSSGNMFGREDNVLKVWDMETWGMVRTLEGHTGWINAITVTPNGRYVISGSNDNTLKVWDLEAWEEVKTLEGHTKYVMAVTVTPDSRYVISGSGDKTLKIWNIETWEEVKTLEGHAAWVISIAVTPDNRYVISVSEDNTLKVWDLEAWKVVASFTDSSSLHACAVAPDGKTIVAGGVSGQVHFLEWRDGRIG